jgi:ribosomal protein S18 acetylase RimI-like enzyme
MPEFPILIRNLLPKDEDRLMEICYLTGNPILDDKYLFGLRWCLYYLWHQPENSFAAADRGTDEMVGFMVGALDTAAQEQHYRQVMVPEVKRCWKRYHPKTLRAWAGYLLLRLPEISIFNSLYAEYPAHLHINIHPDYQRQGIGQRLFQAYEANLARHKIPGYHLLVGADNQVGISFYRKLGLTELKKFPAVGKSLVFVFGKKIQ